MVSQNYQVENYISNENSTLLDDVYIWVFISLSGFIGVILNLSSIFILLRTKCNGVRYFILQICFCDFGSILLCGPESFYINYRKWLLPEDLCPIYLGIETLTTTATIFFIIAINFHAISTYNLAIINIRRQDKIENEYTELTGEQTDDDNYEIAIDLNKSSRSINIDYGKNKNRISVLFPAFFIWFMSASISIPLFVFGSVVTNEQNTSSVCGVINSNSHNNHLMQIFILLIRVIIPTIALHLTLVFTIIKSFSAKTKIKPCGLEENVKKILKLAILLSISYLLFSIQKIYGSLLFEVLSKLFMNFKYPFVDRKIGLGFSMISFLLPSLRPIIYFVFDKNIFKHSQSVAVK